MFWFVAAMATPISVTDALTMKPPKYVEVVEEQLRLGWSDAELFLSGADIEGVHVIRSETAANEVRVLTAQGELVVGQQPCVYAEQRGNRIAKLSNTNLKFFAESGEELPPVCGDTRELKKLLAMRDLSNAVWERQTEWTGSPIADIQATPNSEQLSADLQAWRPALGQCWTLAQQQLTRTVVYKVRLAGTRKVKPLSTTNHMAVDACLERVLETSAIADGPKKVKLTVTLPEGQ